MDLIASYQNEDRDSVDSSKVNGNHNSLHPEDSVCNLPESTETTSIVQSESSPTNSREFSATIQSINKDYHDQNGNNGENTNNNCVDSISGMMVVDSDNLVTERNSVKRTSLSSPFPEDVDHRDSVFISSFVGNTSSEMPVPSNIDVKECDHDTSILNKQDDDVSPANKLLNNPSIPVPTSVENYIRSDPCKYTESDLCVERAKVAGQYKEVIAIQENMYEKLKHEHDLLQEQNEELKKNKEEMLSFVNGMDDKIEKLAEEVGASKDAQWKQIMQEVIDSSKMEIANLQDQLNRQRVTFNEQKEQMEQKNDRIAELQDALQLKEQTVAQAKQQVLLLEERIEANKKEISELEGLKLSLLHENENRVDFYRGLYEEEMKQKQEIKERLEKQLNQKGEAQQKIDEYERTIRRLQEKVEEEKQARSEKERECDSLQQENQRLVLAVNNLVDKNDRNTAKLQQLQEEYSSLVQSTKK